MIGWAVWIPIIVQHGLPLAERLWRLSAGSGEPTQAEWDELKGLAAKTATAQMAEALVKAGIEPGSPRAIALLELTKGI